MKKSVIIMLATSVLAIACGKKELSEEKALILITKERGYPKSVNYEVFTADPMYAKMLLDKGFETQGYVAVQKTQKMSEIGNPLVLFTEKSKNYLLPVTPDDEKSAIQKVKIADEEVLEITGIEEGRNDGRATVHYRTLYKNLTPFAELLKVDGKEPYERKADFVVIDGEWAIYKRK